MRTDSIVNERKVVIADDEPGLLQLLKAVVGSEHYEVLTALNGNDALDLIREHRPDFALLDVWMPGRTGIQVVEAVRKDSSLDDVQLVLLSAQGDAAHVEAGLAAGAAYYLKKPFSAFKLRQLVQDGILAA